MDLNEVLLGFTNYVQNERVRSYNEGVDAERERCATVALEQRCERGTPWDRACVAIAKAIRG
jgi:hypothetical protein